MIQLIQRFITKETQVDVVSRGHSTNKDSSREPGSVLHFHCCHSCRSGHRRHRLVAAFPTNPSLDLPQLRFLAAHGNPCKQTFQGIWSLKTTTRDVKLRHAHPCSCSCTDTPTHAHAHLQTHTQIHTRTSAWTCTHRNMQKVAQTSSNTHCLGAHA